MQCLSFTFNIGGGELFVQLELQLDTHSPHCLNLFLDPVQCSRVSLGIELKLFDSFNIL